MKEETIKQHIRNSDGDDFKTDTVNVHWVSSHEVYVHDLKTGRLYIIEVDKVSSRYTRYYITKGKKYPAGA